MEKNVCLPFGSADFCSLNSVPVVLGMSANAAPTMFSRREMAGEYPPKEPPDCARPIASRIAERRSTDDPVFASIGARLNIPEV
jgi:hypothetical protein